MVGITLQIDPFELSNNCHFNFSYYKLATVVVSFGQGYVKQDADRQEYRSVVSVRVELQHRRDPIEQPVPLFLLLLIP
jgi:hypothetical protein